jgi:hypothetical protein
MWRVGLKTSTDTMEGHLVERRIILKINLEIRWESVDCVRLDRIGGSLQTLVYAVMKLIVPEMSVGLVE